MAKYDTLYGMLKENAEKWGDKEAILYDTTSISYRRLFEDAVKKAIHLKRFEGKEIAIYGPASYRWVVNFFGTLLAGKDAVLIDFFAPAGIRAQKLSKVGIDYVLCSTNQYILSDASAAIIPNAEKDDVTGLAYDTSTKEGSLILFTATPEDGDKPCVIGAKNVITAMERMDRHCECTENDRVLSQIELCRVFGLVYSLIWPLSNGASVCLGRGLRHIDADTYYYRPTILPGSPSNIQYLKKINSFNPELKTVILGEAPCPYELYESLSDRDIKVYTVYGSTETTGSVAINSTEDGSYEIFDEDSVQLGTDGEILVRGDSVTSGYYRDKDATDAAIYGGFFHTGDYGRMNSKGHLVITRRNSGIILLPTGAKICKKVTSNEITAINGIAEARVLLYDSKLVAVVVPMHKDAKPERFKKRIERFNEEKGYRWSIQRVVMYDKPLPKTAEGSVDEKELELIVAQEDKNE
jgi:long-subunit acyl-CoA synthetase (AMP-forming)